MKQHIGRNTGFIEEVRKTDYIFGLASRIIHEDRNTTGFWGQFLPTDERQKGRFFDTMACVSFSALNSLEAQATWMFDNNLLPTPTLEFLNGKNSLNVSFFDDNGRLNFSDRFTAKMSGTTMRGNTLQAVWDSIRRDGVVPEAAWKNNLDTFDRNQYYSEILQKVKDLGQEFLKHFKSEYEWVNDVARLDKALRHAPVQMAGAVCPGWFDGGVVQTCSAAVTHATIVYGRNANNDILDFDHYEPFRKILAKNYRMPFLLKGVLTPILDNSGNVKPVLKFIYDRDLKYGEHSIDVKNLQDRLAVIDPPTGWYGPMTTAAVKRFMLWHDIGSWWEKHVWPAGRRVGPKIRAFLNR